MKDHDRSLTDDNASNEDRPNVSRRTCLRTGAVAGLSAIGLSAGSPATAQPSGTVPSVSEAAEQLSHPDPAAEAIALYRYLHDEWGERILAGQQYEPWWGVDEMDHIESATGHLPAVQGADFIHDDKSRVTRQTLDWWDEGGITSIMWHWGVPGQDTPEDEYEQSRDTGVQIDLQRILEDGTEPNEAFWTELEEVADELAELRDAGVPVIWRPFHEFEGGWFWWGVEGPQFFIELWETMHEYFVSERDLDNLVWLLPHMDDPDPAWVPDESTFDLWGADTYDEHPTYAPIYDDLVSIHGEDRPIVKHETGMPPHPDDAADAGAWWSHWITWHTDWLTDIDEGYLEEIYTHELTATLEDVPDIVAEYAGDGGADPEPEPEPEPEPDPDPDDVIAAFDPSTTEASVGERVTFSVEDTSGSGRWIDSLEFDFGDGTTATGWWAAHSYESAGSYTVVLTATDNEGTSTTDEETITVS